MVLDAGEFVEDAPTFSQHHAPSLRGEFIIHRPIQCVNASDVSTCTGDVGFQLRDRRAALSQPLMVDPTVYWGSFFGGNGVETIQQISYRSDNAMAIVGSTTSPNWPTQGLNRFVLVPS